MNKIALYGALFIALARKLGIGPVASGEEQRENRC